MKALLFRTVPALAVAFLFAQGGEFTQQYRQRLGGTADALRQVVERFDASAAAVGLTRGQAMDRLGASPEALVSRQAQDAAASLREFEAADRRARALAHAAPLVRPLVMLRDPDWSAVGRTAAEFEPAFALGSSGLLLTFAGFVAGWSLGAACEGAARLLRRRTRRRRPAPSALAAARAASPSGFERDPPPL